MPWTDAPDDKNATCGPYMRGEQGAPIHKEDTMHETPTHFTFDGHGLNGNDEYATRVLTFAKDPDGAYLLEYAQRLEVATRLLKAVNTHERAKAAIRELLDYIETPNEARKVAMYPQSIEFAKSILANMEG